MKQSDVAMLILIVAISLTFSFILGNALFAGDSNRSTQVEVIEPISADFPETPTTVFNNRALNPTQTTKIGGSNSDSPFSSEE